MNRLPSACPKLVLCASLALWLGGPAAPSAEFSAKLKKTGPGPETTGRIHVKGETYRMTLQRAEQVLVMISKSGAETTIVAVPLVTAYTEVANDHPMVLSNDPFRVARQPLAGATWAADGSEKIAGYDCAKTVLRSGEKAVMSKWVPAKLGFPLRIAVHGRKDRVMELSAIRERELPDSLFAVPTGYRKVSLDELGELVRAAGSASEAKPKKPAKTTLRSMLGPDSRWRLAIEPGTAVTIKTSPFGEGATWFARSVVKGKPKGDIAKSARKGKGEVVLAPLTTPSVVEIGVMAGDASIEAIVAEPNALRSASSQYKIKPGSSSSRSLKPPSATLAIHVTDTAGGRGSRVSLGFTRTNARGEQKNEPVVATLGAKEKKTWRFTKEDNVTKFNSMVLRGSAEVLIEQVFKAGGLKKPTPGEATPLPKKAPPKKAPPVTRPQPPVEKPAGPPINVLAAKSGTKVIFASSQYDSASWGAKNLIDGKLGSGHQYCSGDNKPQDIVFELPRAAVVSSLVVNPYVTESKPNWAKDVEVWGSVTSAHRGFVKLASFQLVNEKKDQTFSFEPAPVRWVSLRLMSNWGGSYIEAGEAQLVGVFSAPVKALTRVNALAASAGAKLIRCDSQYNATSYGAKNLIDGQLGSGHEYCASSAKPAEIVFAMSKSVRVTVLAFNPSARDQVAHWVKEVEVLLADADSPDGSSFKSVGKFTLSNRPHIDATLRPPDQEFDIEPAEARFVKLRLLSNHGGSYIQMGEFKVYAAAE